MVDVVSILTESNDPAHYWRTLKSRMIQEGNETVTNCDSFKLKAKMGGHAAKVARDDIEKNLGKSVISNQNSLNYE